MITRPGVGRIFTSLRDSAFFKSVILLTSGAAVAHLITLAALPLLTRLYSPEDFSVLAVFSGILSTFAVASCLRFDIAIPMPADDDDALNLVVLAIASACAVALLVGVATFAFAPVLRTLPRLAEVANYLWLLPLGLLIAGLYLASQLYYVRKREFRVLAANRVAQSGLAAGVQLGCGWFGIAPLGLLLGQILNSGAGALLLLTRLIRDEKKVRERVSRENLRRLFSAYRRFPTLSTAEAFANASGIFLPVILIGMLDAGPEAGFLTLAMTIMQAPMSLIGGAVAQVYLSRGPEAFRQQELSRLTSDVLIGLVRSGVGPILFVGIVAPIFIDLVFGPAWVRSGTLIAWMTPWFVLQFLAAPVSMALHVTSHQGRALALQVFGLFTRALSVMAVDALWSGWLSESYAISGFVFYAVYLAVILRTTGARFADVMRARGVWLIPAAWCVAGAAVAWLGALIR